MWDTVTNHLAVTYSEDSANRAYAPIEIQYASNDTSGTVPTISVRFVYETRTDVVPLYLAGSVQQNTERLANIQTYQSGTLMRDYRLGFDVSSPTGRSRLVSISECGGSANCFAGISFAWQENTLGDLDSWESWELSSSDWKVGDFNGDGVSDLIRSANSAFDIYGVDPSGGMSFASHLSIDPCVGWKLGDFNGDGITDIIRAHSNGTTQIYILQGNGQIAQAWNWSIGLAGLAWNLGDFNGDGRTDIIRAHSNGTTQIYIVDGVGGIAADWNWPVSLHNLAWKLADVNGDGNTDVIRAHPNGTTQFYVTGTDGTIAAAWDWEIGLDGLAWNLGDFNGDGIADIIRAHTNGTTQIYLGNGNGGLAAAWSWAIDLSNFGWRLGDFNGDGIADIIRAHSNGTTQIYVVDGKGGIAAAWDWEIGLDGLAWNLGSFNGDGLSDFFRSTGSSVDLFKVAGPQPDLLAGVTDSLGTTTTVVYNSITYTKEGAATYPNLDLQAPLYVVSEVSTDDGIGGQRTTSYTYAGAKLNLHGRGFLGFRQVTATDQTTGIVTQTTYRQDFPFSGQVERTEQALADGTLIKTVENSFAAKSLNGGLTQFPHVTRSVAASYEINRGPGSAPVIVGTVDTVYDDWGNPTQLIVTTEGGGELFVKTTLNDYLNHTDVWHLGRLMRASVTATRAGTSETHVSAFDYDPITGLLTQEVIEPNTPFALTTTYQYDAFGNKTAATISAADILTRTETTDYGPSGQFPLTTTNALGHSETKTYDARFGKVKTLTGPNGLTTTWDYDGFGRKVLERRADGTESTWAYAFCDATCPTHAVYKLTEQSTGSAPVTVYWDALEREVRSETIGFNGQPVYQDTEYNARGEVARRSRPYQPGESPQWTVFTYDALGRPVTETAPDGGVKRVAYDGLTIVATNALNQTETRYENALGELVQVTDHAGGSTTFEFDAFGNLIHTLDADFNHTWMDYDIRGRKTAMSDPNMGKWTYQHNALGELVAQTNAKGQTVTMAYDRLGRMVRRSEPEGTTTWEYDTATKGIGKLARVSGPNGYLEVAGYDGFGRPSQSQVTIALEPFTVSRSYDAAGRLDTLTYPTGFALRHIYTAHGHLAALRDAGTNALYWQADSIDAEGRVTQETLGNGVITTRTYDAASGHLQAIGTGKAGGLEVQDLAFTFDVAGRLLERQDHTSGLLESFTYDGLNRLQTAALVDQVSGAQVLKSYAYSATGNIASKSDVGPYTYGTDAGPHAVTEAGGHAYFYDANGNLTAGAGRSVTWSSFNKPLHISGAGATSTFLYGPERARIQHTISTGAKTTTIKYVGALFEKVTETGASTERRHYIFAGDARIAVLTQKSDATSKTRYLHTDHLGSVSAVTDEAGNVVERLGYDPHGKRRQLNGQDSPFPIVAQETSRGYTGHEHLDELGLIHMNGRIYDPTLGRFLSADPYIGAATNTQSFNRYSYVLNNPLSYTDPSGYFFKSIARAFKRVAKAVSRALSNPYVRTAVAVAAAAFTAGTSLIALTGANSLAAAYGAATIGQLAAAGAAAGFVSGTITTGSLTGGLRGALFGAASAAAAFSIGHLSGLEGVFKHAAHGIAQGALSQAAGGDFRSGFVGGFSGSAFPIPDNLGGTGPGGLIARTVAAATVGGTASALGGGKFANGAVTSAFAHLFSGGGVRQQQGCNASSGGFLKGVLDVVGKIWALPNTIVGLAYGGVGMLFGATPAWDSQAGILRFIDMPGWMMPSAMSLGHVQVFGPGSYKNPDGTYALNRFGIPVVTEETLHTRQAEILGPFYFPLHGISMGTSILTGGGTHDNNLLEQGPERGLGPWPWNP